MPVCSSCGSDIPGGFEFCGRCGSPLDPTGRPPAEERKVVTALFCDLVGFTATSESADPEDLDSMLAEYFAMVRGQIQAFGGVVEKFIGDAVVGVFGVPAAHEDDPERAIRAGLRIVEHAEDLAGVDGAPTRLRIGINTGEALVRLGVSPASGEGFLTGDAINTASRIQAIAPEMGVAVGLATYTATAAVFDYEELEPAVLKGKSEPVVVFHAKSPRARLGVDLTRTHDSPFVGRQSDLAILSSIFDKAVATATPHLVTVVGEPGLGKSRIVAELGAYVDDRPELVTWRQGRCLPYGDGITFWALGEIVKVHAGILESDAPATATARLDAVLPGGPERPWFRQRMLPLLGIEATSGAEREELFTAWRRFLEHIAEQGPTVLVFEDLHWADPAMLEFLEHVADRAEVVPLLVIGTARPELFDRRPDYAAGTRNAANVTLAPLSEEETGRLVTALLGATVLPAELQRPILERAEGNPLYAEEFVRLLRDTDLLVPKGRSWELRPGAEIPFPDSVQALIAARLDTLETGAKALLADAAVIGKVFWAGALAEMGERDRADVQSTLRDLSRKELVRPDRRSSMEGEAEYAFWHVLVRDVAYGQLPRASRASRHVAVAGWIEAKAAGRLEDLADVLASHYATAVELLRATGETARADELEPQALRFLLLAAERALGQDASSALDQLERALAFVPPGRPERPKVLASLGEAALSAGRYERAAGSFEEAISIYRRDGNLAAAADMTMSLSGVLNSVGDPRVFEMPGEALALLEPLGPSVELVRALGQYAIIETISGRVEEGLRQADRALTMAQEIGMPVPARILGFRAAARTELGEAAGLEDYREAITLAIAAGEGRQVALLYNNLGLTLGQFEGPTAALETLRVGIEYARARGLTSSVDLLRSSSLDASVDAGELDEALELASILTGGQEAGDSIFRSILARAVRARIAALRGSSIEVAHDLDRLESSSRSSGDPQLIVQGLASSAAARAALGQPGNAAALLLETVEYPGIHDNASFPSHLAPMVRTALAIVDLALAHAVVAGYEPRYPHGSHALVAGQAALAEAGGELDAAAEAYAEAVERWERFGVVPEQAFALLGLGRCQLQLSGLAVASATLLRARDVFERLEARPPVMEIDALLQGGSRTELLVIVTSPSVGLIGRVGREPPHQK